MDNSLRDEWFGLQTAIVCDILDTLGYRHQTLPWEIQALVTGTKLFGQAFTIIGQPCTDDSENDNAVRVDMLSQFTPGSIAVMSAVDNRNSAHWGEITALAARNNGCCGAVVDGGTRDVGKLIEHKFPVFARFRSPAASTGRWSVKRWQVPIRVEDVNINPGDYLFGDEDGVIAIPRDMMPQVLTLTKEKFNKESGMRAELAQGVTITDIFKKYGHF